MKFTVTVVLNDAWYSWVLAKTVSTHSLEVSLLPSVTWKTLLPTGPLRPETDTVCPLSSFCAPENNAATALGLKLLSDPFHVPWISGYLQPASKNNVANGNITRLTLMNSIYPCPYSLSTENRRWVYYIKPDTESLFISDETHQKQQKQLVTALFTLLSLDGLL